MRGETLTRAGANHTKAAIGLGSAAITSAAEGAASAALDSRAKPLLAELVKGIRLRSSVLYRPEFGAPWGVSIDRSTAQRPGIADHFSVFHIVAHGSCWLQLRCVPKPVLLSEGDFVVITRGDAHLLRDTPDTPAINYFEIAKRCAARPGWRISRRRRGAHYEIRVRRHGSRGRGHESPARRPSASPAHKGDGTECSFLHTHDSQTYLGRTRLRRSWSR